MAHFEPAFSYDAPPEGEIGLDFGEAAVYAREVTRCALCGHFISSHDLDLEGLYKGRYVDTAYGETGLSRTYDRIMALLVDGEPEESFPPALRQVTRQVMQQVTRQVTRRLDKILILTIFQKEKTVTVVFSLSYSERSPRGGKSLSPILSLSKNPEFR